jgi:transposase
MEPSREQRVVGLDVSKAWLDGYVPTGGRRFRVSNDPAGIEDLLRSGVVRGDCLMVLEASGGYERTAHRALVAQGAPAAIVNPKRVRDFARGMGLEAKTDRVDAPGRCRGDRALWRGDGSAAGPSPAG